MQGGASPDSGKGAVILKPNMYAVIVHGQNQADMTDLLDVLINIFHKSASQAHSLVMQIRKEGKGMIGRYPYDIAISKRFQAEKYADDKEFSLRISVEAV